MTPHPDEELLAPGVVEAVFAKPWPVIAAAVVGLLVAFGVTTFVLDEQYRATITVTITDPDQATFTDRGSLTANYERYLASTASFADSAAVQAAADELGVSRSVLDDAVSVRADVNDRALKIVATGPDGRVAAERANAVAAAFDEAHAEHLAAQAAREIGVLDEQIGLAQADANAARAALAVNPEDVAAIASLDEANAVIRSLRETRVRISVNASTYGSGVEFLEPATAPRDPTSPNTRLNLAVGLLVGTLAGVSFVWLRTDRRRPLQSSDEPRTLIDVPLLGKIPEVKAPSTRLSDPRRMPSDDYQFVASALRATLGDDGRVVLVGGSGAGAGTTVTAANLAVAAARDDLTVAVVDGCGDEGLAKLFGRPVMQPGLLDLAGGEAEVDRQRLTWALGPVSVDGRSVRFLAYGTDDRTAAANELRSRGARAIIEELRSRFDIVFIDCGCVLTSPTAGALAVTADAMVLVIRNGAEADSVVEARERLAVERVPVVGYVFTHADPTERRRFRSANLGVGAASAGGVGEEPRTWPSRSLPGSRRGLTPAEDGSRDEPSRFEEFLGGQPSRDEPPREEPPVEDEVVDEWRWDDDESGQPSEGGDTSDHEPVAEATTDDEAGEDAGIEAPPSQRAAPAGPGSVDGGATPDDRPVREPSTAGRPHGGEVGGPDGQPGAESGHDRDDAAGYPRRNGSAGSFGSRPAGSETNRVTTWSLPPSAPLVLPRNREAH